TVPLHPDTPGSNSGIKIVARSKLKSLYVQSLVMLRQRRRAGILLA
ncbi:MAG: hypothetical protein QOH09_3499, partial [Pseudonocardiales bacterium]|nr:hypothetical protein [Pseudonocardiales bacterium]